MTGEQLVLSGGSKQPAAFGLQGLVFQWRWRTGKDFGYFADAAE